jgi:hypothetical protein
MGELKSSKSKVVMHATELMYSYTQNNKKILTYLCDNLNES